MFYVLLNVNTLHVSALKRHPYEKFCTISNAVEIALFCVFAPL
jgi:hypothetical protein